MEERGMRILQEIKNAIADDPETGLVDKTQLNQTLKPFKKINRKDLQHFSGEVTSLAAMADRDEGRPDKIHVTCGPVYHFFKQETLDAFLQRATNIIIAAEI